MLGRNSYPAAQIAACRAQMGAVAATWRAISSASDARTTAEAEVQIFNQMVVALDGWFVYRLRGQEGKDGNPMNEVRLLALGVTSNRGYFPADPTIKWRPEASVSGLHSGDPIRLDEPTFSRLAIAYLDAISQRFAEA